VIFLISSTPEEGENDSISLFTPLKGNRIMLITGCAGCLIFLISIIKSNGSLAVEDIGIFGVSVGLIGITHFLVIPPRMRFFDDSFDYPSFFIFGGLKIPYSCIVSFPELPEAADEKQKKAWRTHFIVFAMVKGKRKVLIIPRRMIHRTTGIDILSWLKSKTQES
jgi:hypothetical protein